MTDVVAVGTTTAAIKDRIRDHILKTQLDRNHHRKEKNIRMEQHNETIWIKMEA